MLEDQLGPERLAEMRFHAEAQLEGLDDQVAAINDALRIDLDGIDLPAIVVPGHDGVAGNGTPLLDSDWSHAEQCRALLARKAYEVKS